MEYEWVIYLCTLNVLYKLIVHTYTRIGRRQVHVYYQSRILKIHFKNILILDF